MKAKYDSAKLQDQISSTCIDLIFNDAFFGHFLLSINRELSEDGPTLWVRPSDDDKVIMGINPDFWNTELKSTNFRMGCVKHEVLHVVFKHLTRAQEMSGGRRIYSNHKLFNIAADLVVNQYVKPSWLIKGAVKLESFPDLNLRKEMDVSYYYNKLEDFFKEQGGESALASQCPSCGQELGSAESGGSGGDGDEEGESGGSGGDGGGSGGGDGDEEGESGGSGGGDGDEEGESEGSGGEGDEEGESEGSGGGEGDEEGESGGSGGDGDEEGESEGSGDGEEGKCPHCGEDTDQGEGGEDDGQGEGEGQGEGTGGGSGSSESWSNLQSQFSQGPGARGGYHGFWGELDESTEAQKEVLEEWVDRQIVNAVNRLDSTNTWGDLPGSLKDYLEEFMKTRKPKVDWRRSLRLFTENSQNTYISNTLKRPSRRYKKISHWPDGSPMYESKDGIPVKDENGNFIPVWEPKYPGLKVRQRSSLLVALDTSGSIRTDEDLPKFFNEMYHLQKKEVEILVVEIDEWIQRIYPFPLPEGKIDVKGRGGTDFNELIKYANGEEIDRSGKTKSYQKGHTYSKGAGITVWEKGEWVSKKSIKLKKQIDGIVYFTDGQAATPFEVSKLPILWVLAGSDIIDENSKAYENLPGQKVKIEDK